MSEIPKNTHTTEIEENQSVTWGEGNPTLENHTRDLHCTNPECNFDFSPAFTKKDKKITIKFTVGVQKAPFANSSGMEFAQILECPKCFTQSWLHTDKLLAETLKILKKFE